MKTAARFPLERFVAIDRAIRSGGYPNATSLGDTLEVDRRTIQRDLQFLRDRLGAPLAFDPRRNGYYYSNPDFRYSPIGMTEGELVALLLAERALQGYRGTPYAADLARLFRKITTGLTDRVTIDLAHLGETHSFRSPAATGVDPAMFGELGAAIRDRRRLAIRYYSASRDAESTREVDPYHLASVNAQWYLVAFCHAREEVRLFVPARIRSLAPTGVTFVSPVDFRIDDYLALSFAVMRGVAGERHRVKLRFTGEAVRYVRERTWHPTQVIEEDMDGGLVLGLTVGHLREIERFALSWGQACEVLEPPELRERVAFELAAAASRYRVEI